MYRIGFEKKLVAYPLIYILRRLYFFKIFYKMVQKI